MNLQIPEQAISMIAGFEGGESPDGLYYAYWDQYGECWTIGCGETHDVHEGMVWTRAQAYADLRTRLAADYLPAIEALDVPLNPNQVAALCDFVWNLGPGSMQWDVGRLIRDREFTAAADAMLAYDRSGGVVLAGLARRRQAEHDLFLAPWHNPDPDGYLRFETIPRDITHGRHPRQVTERATVETYDRLRPHPARNRRALEGLRDDCSVLAARIGRVMEDDPGARDLFYRPWRRSQLEARAAGRRMV